MYVVVAGAGEVGRAIARTLRAEGHDVVVVDTDPEALERVQRMDVLGIPGSATTPAVLANAGVAKAALFYAVTDQDEVNLLSCAMAKAKNPRCRTIARVNGLEYMRDLVSEEFKPVGCDVAVCPELVAAHRIARLLDIPRLIDADVFAQGRVQVLESRVRATSKVAGHKVKDLAFPSGGRLAAIFRDDDVLIPDGGETLRPEDRLLSVARDAQTVRQVHALVGDGADVLQAAVRRVLVVGATRVGTHLARLLSQQKEVMLLDRDRARCQAVTDQLPNVLVVQGDAADRETLESEGIDRVDAILGCDERDEFNILSCLLAKQLGVPRAVALVGQGELKNVAERIGIDLAVSPRQASIGAFLRYAHENVPVKLYLLAGGEAQVLEVEVGARSPLAGARVRKAGFPKDSLVGAIVRGKEVVVPTGEDVIQAGDRLVVFALTDAVPKLRKLL